MDFSHSGVGAPTYQIRVKGVLEQQWSSRLGGLTLSYDENDTVLTGPIVDQAALHGLLAQIRDLGLTLLLVQQIESSTRPVVPHPSEKLNPTHI